jgi:hypothetical protein
MAAPGLGRVKTVSQGRRTWEPGPRCVSGHDRSHQRLGTDDVHAPCQITGEDRESHLGGYFWKRFGEKMCCPHAGLHRAERMLVLSTTVSLDFRYSTSRNKTKNSPSPLAAYRPQSR